MKKRILSLAMVLALVAVLVMPMAALAANTGDTTVTGDLADAAMSITAPTAATSLVLAYNETAQTLISATPAEQGSVTSSVPFTVTVSDPMPVFTGAKPTGSYGKMVEATASAWVTLVLQNPVKVGSIYTTGGAAAANLVTPGIVIIDSSAITAAAAAADMLAIVTQTLDLAAPLWDEPAPDTNVYRIVLTFTIAEKS